MSNDIRNASIKELASHFENSIIRVATKEEAVKVVQESIEMGFHSVITAPFLTPLVAEIAKGSDLKVGTAFSFPMGADTPVTKAAAAKDIAENYPVDEIDYVMNVAALKAGLVDVVETEAKMIRAAAPDKSIRMIMEVCYLTDDEIRTAIRIAGEAGLDYVKSSTGQLAGPTMEQVFIMVEEAKKYPGLMTKVAGVKEPKPLVAMAYLLAGIDRIGTQDAVKIVNGIETLREHDIF